MIWVYFLPVERTAEGEQVLGVTLMHGGLLECTEDPDVRKLIQDTTPDEHAQLDALAISVRQPTQDELDLLNATPVMLPPNIDVIRAGELLQTSSDVITQPEIWELLRIFGRRLGY